MVLYIKNQNRFVIVALMEKNCEVIKRKVKFWTCGTCIVKYDYTQDYPPRPHPRINSDCPMICYV